jgi:sec-independent protein translocase protein TatA
MGFHGFSLGSLILIAVIVIVLFGTKRLRSIGEDIGAALKGFRKGLNGEETSPTPKSPPEEGTFREK